MSTRIILLASLVALTAFAFAPTATAAEPDVGCGGDTLEVCMPTCVQAPCPAYVCVHTDSGSVCRVLWT